jgi:hypothetical protein
MPPTAWRLLAYRLPPQPSSTRVAVWREIRRLGAVSLQQSCIVVPEIDGVIERLDAIVARIHASGGTEHQFTLRDLGAKTQARLSDEWNALRAQEFAEIVEECETKFRREVEFEIFRDNLTAAEAEELEADLDKIRSWFGRVRARDWFDAPGRPEAESAIVECERLLDDFTERVFHRESEEGPSLLPPADVPWGEPEATTKAAVLPIRSRSRKRCGAK